MRTCARHPAASGSMGKHTIALASAPSAPTGRSDVLEHPIDRMGPGGAGPAGAMRTAIAQAGKVWLDGLDLDECRCSSLCGNPLVTHRHTHIAHSLVIASADSLGLGDECMGRGLAGWMGLLLAGWSQRGEQLQWLMTWAASHDAASTAPESTW